MLLNIKMKLILIFLIAIIIIMSFFFKCCKQDTNVDKGVTYQIQKKQGNIIKTEFVNNLKDIKKMEDVAVMRVSRSSYDQLIKNYSPTNPFRDLQFPPGPKSLGNIPNVPQNCQWKRISQILQKPQLFEGIIQPKDVIQGSLGDCYFLSAISALAQRQGRITKVFGNQKYNPSGIYKVTLRIDGIIQEILLDDYVPVNKANKPIFCQPNKNEFWVLLLEKAWAKAHGSYENINTGTPCEVFKAVTYAPAELKQIKSDPENMNKLWTNIIDSCQKRSPICCGTQNNKHNINWSQVGLTPDHAYSLIDAANLTDSNGQLNRMIKLRNPWGYNQWTGRGNENDHGFWSRINANAQKQRFLSNNQFGNDGIFFMTYEDFCQHFNEIHFSYLLQNAMYETERMYSDKKHGSIFTFNVKNPGQYYIQLHQNGLRGENDIRLKQGLNRSTILVAKGNNYEFIDGSLKYKEQDNTLKLNLNTGQYYIYTKIDPTLEHQLMPEFMSVSSYSEHMVDIIPVDKTTHPNFFKKVFLSYARNNRRKEMDNGLMWISWKLFFEKGGYAYLAFGVDQRSDKKFIVTINQKDFNELGYILKKPHKGKGNQTLEIRPGQQQIIVARVKNSLSQNMSFPPPMEIHIDKA